MRLSALPLLLLGACATATDSASGDAAAGATIYADNCESCHGADGTGGGTYPDLTAGIESNEVVEVVTNGEGDMPAFGESLSEQDILDVAAYVDETFVNP